MDPTRITSEHADGRRKLSPETRAKLSETARARFAALPPEEQERQRARLRRGAPPPAPPPPAGGSPNPLDDAPRARPGAVPPAPRGVAANGHDRIGAPIFRVPDFDPLPPSSAALEGPAGELETADPLSGIQVSQDQVGEFLALPFRLVARRRGDHWRLSPEERDELAAPLTRKINEHAAVSRALGLGGDWLLIFGGLAIVVSSRLAEDVSHVDRPGAGAAGGAPVELATIRAERASEVHPDPGGGDGGVPGGRGAGAVGGLNGFAPGFGVGPIAD